MSEYRRREQSITLARVDDEIDPGMGDRDELLTLNFGPHHPATHGVLRLLVTLQAEIVRDIKPIIGYVHTGIEKTAEDKAYWKVIPVVERMDYLSYYFNAMAYCGAVEALVEVDVPKRGQYLRVIHLELNRIASHLIWLGTSALDLGATSPGFEQMVRKFLKVMPERADEYGAILNSNEIVLQRLRGTCPLDAQTLLGLGVSGPLLRAAGNPWDLRKADPYSSYEDFDFKIPVGTVGDNYDRFAVRLAEIYESVKIIGQALDGLPEGPYITEDRKVALPPRHELATSMEALIHHFKLVTEGFRVPPGEVYNPIESPRGELGCYVRSDGSSKPARVHMRDPSFVNLQALAPMVKGSYIADMIATTAMLDPILGGIDR
jgi:NADH-quinone oxidoreductase subunit D